MLNDACGLIILWPYENPSLIMCLSFSPVCVAVVRYGCIVGCISLILGSVRTRAADPVQPTGVVEIISGDFEFTEGPAWDASSKTLYFSDIPKSAVHRLTSNKKIEVLTADSMHTNGMIVTANGRLLACQMDGRVVSYDQKNGDATVIADSYDGKRFNAPNDLVIDAQGGIYFTDPLFRAPTPLPQGVQTVYYVTPGGEVSRVTGDIAAPNGIGLSPDGKSLYVIPSQQAEMLVYTVDAPGKLSAGRTFCRLAQPEGKDSTGGDGMVLDVEGNLYITTHLGVQISGADGSARGLIAFPEQPANVTFGGEERKTMYVTARTGLYQVEMPIAGLLSE